MWAVLDFLPSSPHLKDSCHFLLPISQIHVASGETSSVSPRHSGDEVCFTRSLAPRSPLPSSLACVLCILFCACSLHRAHSSVACPVFSSPLKSFSCSPFSSTVELFVSVKAGPVVATWRMSPPLTLPLCIFSDPCTLCYLGTSLFFFPFGPGHGLQKFLGQGLNTHHGSGLSHCSDDARSLNCCTTRELLGVSLFAFICLCSIFPPRLRAHQSWNCALFFFVFPGLCGNLNRPGVGDYLHERVLAWKLGNKIPCWSVPGYVIILGSFENFLKILDTWQKHLWFSLFAYSMSILLLF